MSHVKINNKGGDTTKDSNIFAASVSYAGEKALTVTCPVMCFDKDPSQAGAVFKRCVNAEVDCKTGQTKLATTLKTDFAKNFHLMAVKAAGDEMNTTSCPTCTGATCDNTAAYTNDKSKCKDNAECQTACMYYKWIHCKGVLDAADKKESDVGKCVDTEMNKIGCTHPTADNKCMPAAATGGASTAGGIAGALMAVAVALLH
eukprot:GHVU01168273.1.p1 GENE.GHVU01168273.1~~GHVU01168273.1.p1  ORF type:complete len:231 (-),score=44.39 GHVU01168273.1:29-634(-)